MKKIYLHTKKMEQQFIAPKFWDQSQRRKDWRISLSPIVANPRSRWFSDNRFVLFDLSHSAFRQLFALLVQPVQSLICFASYFEISDLKFQFLHFCGTEWLASLDTWRNFIYFLAWFHSSPSSHNGNQRNKIVTHHLPII